MTSFQRQLNLYGFRRLTKGQESGSYFHPQFQRNREDLISQVRRVPPKTFLATLEEVIAATNSHRVNRGRGRPTKESALTPGGQAQPAKTASVTPVTKTPVNNNTDAPERSRRNGLRSSTTVNKSISEGLAPLTIPPYQPHVTPAYKSAALRPYATAPSPLAFYPSMRSHGSSHIGYMRDSMPLLLSPTHRAHDDFSDLCPDLIGSPFLSHTLVDSGMLLSAYGDLNEALASPMGVSGPIGDYLTGSMDSLDGGMEGQKNLLDSLTTATDAPPQVTPVRYHCGNTELSVENISANIEKSLPSSLHLPALPAATAAASVPIHSNDWLSGHGADAFDALIDFLCPTTSDAYRDPINSADNHITSSSSASAPGNTPTPDAAPTDCITHKDTTTTMITSTQCA